jgi:hypothetical protein
MPDELRRQTDHGWLCWIAARLADFWDFIDKRDIDKHAVSVMILLGTWRITEWLFQFVESHMDKSGVELAAVVAAITVPWTALQAAAISFYFKARQ